MYVMLPLTKGHLFNKDRLNSLAEVIFLLKGDTVVPKLQCLLSSEIKTISQINHFRPVRPTGGLNSEDPVYLLVDLLVSINNALCWLMIVREVEI